MKTSELLQSSSLSLPSDSYIYSVIPVIGNTTIAAISSDDTLSIFDSTTLQVISNCAFGKIHDGVTCLKNLDAKAGVLVTVGRDAKIQCFDPRTGRNPSLELRHGPNAPYLALACKGDTVAAGTELTQSQATISAWDYRSPKQPFIKYVESHNDDVTELQFHPGNPSWLLSGSTDGLVNIIDTAVADEDEALVQITNHGSSIHCGGFLSGTELYALSHDETFSIYQLDASSDIETIPPQAFGDVRIGSSCDYVVDVVSSGNGTAVLGAGSYRKQHLDLVPLSFTTEWVLDFNRFIRLPGAHGEQIVRSMCFDHSEKTIFTGGEDGLVKAWRVPEADTTHMLALCEPEDVKKRKDQKAPESSKARFKPY